MPPLHETALPGSDTLPLLLCLSHLRWDFVFQRPQHLLTRASAHYRVLFLEEPVHGGAEPPRMAVRATPEGVTVATPHLPGGLDEAASEQAQRALLDATLAGLGRAPDVLWFYSPMFMAVAGHLDAPVVVYDCMDELSLFRGAPSRLQRLESALFDRAGLVFCGGRSLHEAKRGRHPSVHLFPSSIDAAHFAPARATGAHALPDPAGQAALRRPRIGYFGVIDERIDLALVEPVARLRPDWEFVMLGPLAKLEPEALPQAPNLHWLGGRRYAELPAHLAHWDAGLMPFALNEATRFISPTKTPEFLAAGVPVVSTPVADVVRDWGGPDREGGTALVRIAADAPGVVAALEATLAEPRAPWLARVDARLALMSWDMTWAAMRAEIAAVHALSPAGDSSSPSPGSTKDIAHV
ncbi:MAG: glycosyltransferase [Janthinobacterium lividum]